MEKDEMMSALYLQVSIISQALIFVTRSRSWCFVERPGMLLCGAFVAAQIVSISISIFLFLAAATANANAIAAIDGLIWCCKCQCHCRH
mgnify:CR=1 FL=1|jgi:hypothetical protein